MQASGTTGQREWLLEFKSERLIHDTSQGMRIYVDRIGGETSGDHSMVRLRQHE